MKIFRGVFLQTANAALYEATRRLLAGLGAAVLGKPARERVHLDAASGSAGRDGPRMA
jgi:hypothetical protein